MHGLRDGIAHASNRAEGVGARAQMCDRAKVFEAVALLGDGVGLWVLDHANDMHFGGLELAILPSAGRFGDRAHHLHGAAGAQLRNGLVVGQGLIRHYLQVCKAGPVVYGQ